MSMRMAMLLLAEDAQNSFIDAVERDRLLRELKIRWRCGSLGAGILLFLQRNL